MRPRKCATNAVTTNSLIICIVLDVKSAYNRAVGWAIMPSSRGPVNNVAHARDAINDSIMCIGINLKPDNNINCMLLHVCLLVMHLHSIHTTRNLHNVIISEPHLIHACTCTVLGLPT